MKLQCSLRGFFTFEISLSNRLSPKATGDLSEAYHGLSPKTPTCCSPEPLTLTRCMPRVLETIDASPLAP